MTEKETLPKDLESLGTIMSNIDHEIEDNAEEKLRTGKFWGEYTAWNFWAAIWFEEAINKFKAMIKQYRVHVATITGDDLSEIMELASEEYGYR